MSSSDEDHTCPICLEPIFQPASFDTDANGNPTGGSNRFNIGATVPCGHLYHYDCFGSWQASRSYGAVKCPTCNVQTENFVRLYLDVGSLAGAQCHLAEDDDISLSSVEDDNHVDDENHENDDRGDEEGKTEEPKEQDSNNGDENDDVVDLTKSPQSPERKPLHPSKTTASGDHNDRSQVRRFARIAKKFKRQYLQKSAQYKEQYTQKRKLADRARQAEGELSSIQEELTEFERDRELTELKMNESRLDLIRTQQERDTLKFRYSGMAKEKSRAETQLRECRSHYTKELEMARAKSMSEVQEILEEHPKVVEENRVLKQRLQKLNRSLSRGDSMSSYRSETTSRCQFKDINRALRQMDHQLRSCQDTVPSTTITAKRSVSNISRASGIQTNVDSARFQHRTTSNRGTATIKVNSGQYSSLASRMMKASQKVKRSPQGAVVGKKRSTVTSLSLSQNKRMKSFSASRRDLFQRKP